MKRKVIIHIETDKTGLLCGNNCPWRNRIVCTLFVNRYNEIMSLSQGSKPSELKRHRQCVAAEKKAVTA